jgi:hypothetical protein
VLYRILGISCVAEELLTSLEERSSIKLVKRGDLNEEYRSENREELSPNKDGALGRTVRKEMLS